MDPKGHHVTEDEYTEYIRKRAEQEQAIIKANLRMIHQDRRRRAEERRRLDDEALKACRVEDTSRYRPSAEKLAELHRRLDEIAAARKAAERGEAS